MQVRLQGRGFSASPVQVLDVETTVIYDDHAVPMLIVKKMPQGVLVYDAADGDLVGLLDKLGISQKPRYSLLADLEISDRVKAN